MAHPEIMVRNVRFELDRSLPKYWLGGKRALSMFLDQLSIVFPPGERFFMSLSPGDLKRHIRRLEKADGADITSRPDFQRFYPRVALVTVRVTRIVVGAPKE